MTLRNSLVGLFLSCFLFTLGHAEPKTARTPAQVAKQFAQGKGLYPKGSKGRKVVTGRKNYLGATKEGGFTPSAFHQDSIHGGTEGDILPQVQSLPGGRSLLVRWMPSVVKTEVSSTGRSYLTRSLPRAEVLGVVAHGGKNGLLSGRPTSSGTRLTETTTVYPVHRAMRGLVEKTLRNATGRTRDARSLDVEFKD